MGHKELRTLLLIALVLVLLIPILTYAQQWSGIIDPSRAVDWSGAGVVGGIPNRTTICATLNPGATAAQINSALSACPAGQVVYLNAGTYNLSAAIKTTGKSNVTLRGAGANQTLLVFSNSSDCWGQPSDICFRGVDGNYAGSPSNVALFTGAGPWPRGTNSIALSTTANLSVGSVVTLDQVDDLSDSGTIYNCEQSATISPNQNPPCNDDSNATGGDSGAQRGSGTPSVRGQQQMVTVTAISGNTITFTPGLDMPNWRVFTDSRGTNAPGAWWATSPASGMGVENLSVDHSNSSAFLGTMLYNCNNCYVSGIRSINSDRDHVAIYDSAHVTVRDSYFYGTKNSVSQSYGVEAFVSSDDLIENNIGQKVAVPFMINSDCEGCIVSYNFSINDYYTASANWMMQGIFLHSLTSNILLEGNIGSGVIGDLFHGTHNFITAFRNRFDGHQSNNGTATTGNTNPVKLYPYSRYFNLVGNVLGTSGYHTSYQYTISPEQSAGDTSVMVIGTGPVTCCQAGDPLTVSTLMRWGNYDTVNNAVRFVNSEVPSGLSLYANAVPSSQALPASFYRSTQPSWWGIMPWPAIGPDVTGGNISGVGGHAYMTPAAACYTNTMAGPANGVGNVLSFNAATCYGGGTSDTTPPTTSITSPASGATVSGTTAVTASASDNIGVTKVELYVDGVLKSTDTASPNAFSLDTTPLTNASHALSTKAYDAAGNVGTSGNVSVTENNADVQAPTTPAGLTVGTVTTSTVALSWTASTDNIGVTGYKVYRNSTQVGTSVTNSYSDTGLVASTQYSYTVSAYDAAGNNSAQSASASATTQSSGGTSSIGPADVFITMNGNAVGTTINS